METAFTPLSALMGGALIGAASVGLMAVHGRVAGISGLLGKLVPPHSNMKDQTALGFVLGLLLAVPLYVLISGQSVAVWVPSSPVLIIAAGLITGLGVVIGNGCTSGHGVCGISRLSQRSIIGTCMFMATAFITVFIVRHVVGG